MIWLTVLLAILLVSAVVCIFLVTHSKKNASCSAAIPTDVLKGTSSATQLYNATTFTKSTNSIGVTLSPGPASSGATSLKVQFPTSITSGYYQVLLYFFAGNVTFTTQNWALPSAFTNCQYYLPGSSLPVVPPRFLLLQNAPFSPVATSNSSMMQLIYIKVDSAAPSFQINVSQPLTATTNWFLYVTAADSTVANLLA